MGISGFLLDEPPTLDLASAHVRCVHDFLAAIVLISCCVVQSAGNATTQKETATQTSQVRVQKANGKKHTEVEVRLSKVSVYKEQ